MNNCLLISDAAKEVKVESHVLRYWEEELHLPIKRNELGHRYYTEADVQRFKQIKSMKERGLQLKAIKMILKDGRLDMLPEDSAVGAVNIGTAVAEAAEEEGKVSPVMAIDIVNVRRQEEVLSADMGREHKLPEAQQVHTTQKAQLVPAPQSETNSLQGSAEDKSRRLQWVLQEMIRQAMRENNAELCRELKESVIKELDYQFRMQEERDEIRDKRLAERDEEYYKRMDELLRRKSRYARTQKRDKRGRAVEGVAHADMEDVDLESTGVKNAGSECTIKDSVSVTEQSTLRGEGLLKKKRHFF